MYVSVHTILASSKVLPNKTNFRHLLLYMNRSKFSVLNTQPQHGLNLLQTNIMLSFHLLSFKGFFNQFFTAFRCQYLILNSRHKHLALKLSVRFFQVVVTIQKLLGTLQLQAQITHNLEGKECPIHFHIMFNHCVCFITSPPKCIDKKSFITKLRSNE